MKRSELKLTGETYRLTPTSWGDTCIICLTGRPLGLSS